MMIYKKEEALAEELVRVFQEREVHIIGIDGKDGAGKSIVARKLGVLLGLPVISLDNYVEEKKGGYVSFLPTGEIQEQLSAFSGPVLIEGVCLLDAVDRIGFGVDILIYVKRMSAYGDWRDKDECNPSTPAAELIQKLESDLKAFSAFESIWKNQEEDSAEVRLPDLEKEIIRYHAKYRPAQKTDYEFQRVEE